MFENTSKAMIYNFFSTTKIDKNGEERGLICINYIMPSREDTAKNIGWTQKFSWVNFSDELWKYLKTTVLKTCDITFSLREDYRNSNNYIMEITKINDFEIKH